MKAPFLRFRLEDRRAGQKTDTWTVWALYSGSYLGTVHWYSHWRKYTFQPSMGAIVELDATCMREAADWCESRTEKHKKGKRAFDEET